MEAKLTEVKQQQTQENQNTQSEKPSEDQTETKTESHSVASPKKSVDKTPLEMDKQYLVMKDS
jgi:hypothetical protein